MRIEEYRFLKDHPPDRIYTTVRMPGDKKGARCEFTILDWRVRMRCTGVRDKTALWIRETRLDFEGGRK